MQSCGKLITFYNNIELVADIIYCMVDISAQCCFHVDYTALKVVKEESSLDAE